MKYSREELDDLRREFPRESRSFFDGENGWYKIVNGKRVYEEQIEDAQPPEEEDAAQDS